MSVVIRRSELSDEQKLTIRKFLCLTPRVKKPGQPDEFGEPVLFYIVRGEVIHVPFRFAAALFKERFLSLVLENESKWERRALEFRGSLFPYQEEVVKEASDHLQKFGTTIIGLYPGAGKTVMGAYSICEKGFKTVVLFHRELLGGQWDKTFKDYTNAKTVMVREPSSRQKVEEFEEADVILCMDTRTDAIPDFIKEKIGTLVVDEAHCFCTNSRVSSLLSWRPRYVIAETATLERVDGMHSMIRLICGGHGIFRSSSKPFHVIKLMTGITPQVEKTARGVDWSGLLTDLTSSEERNQLILSLCLERFREDKILILTERVDHVKYLHGKLSQAGERVDFLAGSKDKYSDGRILVGSYSKIGTGFDQGGACADFDGVRLRIAILATSIKNLAKLEQNVGRVFRHHDPLVVHLVDNNPSVKRHWTECAKWYQSRNGTISIEHADTKPVFLKTPSLASTSME